VKTVRCILCQGTGVRPTLTGVTQCLDCKGTGCVSHCVACAGRGKLWLGGSEYIDCPVCPSALGGVQTSRTYVVMEGRVFERVPMKAASDG
jgi:hypothetical protein